MGEKTAARLINTYPSLEDLYDHLDDQTPKLRENLAAARDQVFLNRTLMTLVRDVPIDGVAPDEWVAHEYAKVRRLYVKLGLADRTEIEFFDGPHTINGQGTFEFLHRHLDWPKPR